MILATFEPITLPNAISAVNPLARADNEAAKLTASSGNDVPNATKVNPIISGEILNFRAIDEDETIKKSAPLIRNTNPTTSINTLISVSIVYRSF